MSPGDEQDLLRIARACAAVAADELLSRFRAGNGGVRTKSSHTDLVSEADVAAERAVRELLERERPGDAFLGEEGGWSGKGGEGQWRADGQLRWVVDPLDGTTNFVFGLPLFAVSVACEDGDGALAGVVLDPVRGEEFAATRSGPATLDGKELRVAPRGGLDTALVATGFGYDSTVRRRQAEVLTRLLPRVRDIRRCGAAALDLAWCACGRFDAYYERGIKPWDVAAGRLLAERAGLQVHDLPPCGEAAAGILAAPRRWAGELLDMVS